MIFQINLTGISHEYEVLFICPLYLVIRYVLLGSFDFEPHNCPLVLDFVPKSRWVARHLMYLDRHCSRLLFCHTSEIFDEFELIRLLVRIFVYVTS